MDGGTKEKQTEEQSEYNKILTLPNIQFLLEGLDTLLLTNLDGYKRMRVVQLRDKLASYIHSILVDYS